MVASLTLGTGPAHGAMPPSFEPRRGVPSSVPTGGEAGAANGDRSAGGIGLAGEIDVSTGTLDGAYDPANGLVYVPCSDSGPYEVHILNGTRLAATVVLPLGAANYVEGPWIDPASGYVYVAVMHSPTSSVLTVISGTTMLANLSIGGPPNSGVYDGQDGDMYVVNTGSGNVTVVGGATVLANLAIGPTAQPAVYDPTLGYVYVPSYAGRSVDVIDGSALVATVTVGSDPLALAWDPDNGYVYVANSGSNNTSVIAGTRVVASIGGQDYPDGVLYDPQNGLVYVAGVNSGLTVISGTRPIASIPIPPTPGLAGGIGLDPRTGYLYVPVLFDEHLEVVYGTRIIATIRLVSAEVTGVPTYDPRNGYVYLTTDPLGPPGSGSTVDVLDGTTVLARLGVPGSEAATPVCDLSTGLVYVPNVFSDLVSVLSGTTVPVYSVVFFASGLANGTAWSVRINLTTDMSSQPVLAILEPNGTYPYSIGVVGGYSISPANRTATVSGATLPIVLGFAPPAPTVLGLSEVDFAALVTGLVLLGLLVGWASLRRKRRPKAPPPS